MTIQSSQIDEWKRKAEAADAGPWCYEQCGEKCTENVIGIAFRVDGNGNVSSEQLSGRLEPYDDQGREIEYYRESVAFIDDTCTGHLGANMAFIAAARTAVPALIEEVERLTALVNTPATDNFLEGVRIEAAHQIERWGDAHDRDKSAENWFWLVGYLSGKALRAHIDGDRGKALHHTISSAAALLQWHRAITSDPTNCGMGHDKDLAALPPKES